MSCVEERGCHVLWREDVMCCGEKMSCVVEGGWSCIEFGGCHVLRREDVMCCGERMSCVVEGG